MEKRQPTSLLILIKYIRAKLAAGGVYVFITDDPQRDHKRLYKAIARLDRPVPWRFAVDDGAVYIRQRVPSRSERLSQRGDK